jgi:phosphoglycerate dehydrogenase-like enzyme
MSKQAVFVNNRAGSVERVYAKGRRERIGRLTRLYPEIVSIHDLEQHAPKLADAEVVFSTWGMPRLEDAQLDLFPSLKAVFYAAGSVHAFAEPLLRRGIVLSSAWCANAIPVAEYTLAQVLLANKDYFRNARQCSTPEGRAEVSKDMPGNWGETVALLGVGAIGTKLIELLRAFELRIVVWDPFLSQERASYLGVQKVETLEEAFSLGFVVSNHLANVPETVDLITGDHFRLMRPNATFINTGRGATLIEPDLIQVMTERTDLLALLDVTYPEPPEPESALYSLPNVMITSHIAGSLGDEVVRMADYMIDEFLAWERGDPLRYRVTLELLPTMG